MEFLILLMFTKLEMLRDGSEKSFPKVKIMKTFKGIDKL